MFPWISHFSIYQICSFFHKTNAVLTEAASETSSINYDSAYDASKYDLKHKTVTLAIYLIYHYLVFLSIPLHKM